MSGEVLLFPGLTHRPQDIADAEKVLGCAAVFTKQDGPPRIKLVAQPPPNSQISPGAIVPAGASWWRRPSTAMAGGRLPTPQDGRRHLFSTFPHNNSPRRTR